MKRLLPLLCWPTALLLLYAMDPGEGPSLCLFRFVGFDHCPGCGIGHSIHYTLHGHFAAAFQAHYAGIPATIVLLYTITKSFIPKTPPYEPTTTDDAGPAGG